MSDNIQSSVEWLISQLKISTYWNTLIAELEFMDLEIDDILEQAKAMHKADLLITWLQAISEEEPITFEDYYNETFNTKEK